MILVAALARNRVIGREGKLPWHLPYDLEHFKNLTLWRTVVMGSATARSLKKPLPMRDNRVISREDIEGFERIAVDDVSPCAYIIGGAKTYETFLPKATRLELTHVEADVQGDTYFPEVDMSQWLLVRRERHEADTRHEFAFEMCRYERRITT